MDYTIDLTWENNMKFVTQLNGHNLVIDASVENGGNNEGPRPKGLMLVAVAGCSGMDVISILKKMKEDVTWFNVKVEGVTADDHPKKFQTMKIVYEFKGNNLDYSKLEKAVNLSIEKYCGVNANYRDAIKMEYEIKIVN